MVIALFLLILGIPGAVRDRANRRFAGSLYFYSLFRPHWITGLNLYHGTGRLVLFMVLLYLFGLTLFSAFTSLLFPVFIGGLGLFFCITLALIIGKSKDFPKVLLSLLAPKFLIVTGILVFVAIRGPFYFWYLMWTSDLFKMLFFSIFFMLLFRKFHIYIVLSKKWSQGTFSSGAMVFLVLGFQLLLAGLVLLLFGLEQSLTALNNELLVLPTGLSKIMGITTHLSIPLALPWWIIYFSAGLIFISFLIFMLDSRKGRQ